MFSEVQQKFLTQAARTMQIIVCALIIGVICFALVVLVGGLAPEKPPEAPIVSIIAAVFAVGSLVAAPLLPKLVTSGSQQSLVQGQPIHQHSMFAQEALGDVGPLVGVFQTRLIIGRAILEGAAFFNLAAYMIEAQPISLGFTVVLLIAMVFNFPTREKLESWVRAELATIEQLRSLGS